MFFNKFSKEVSLYQLLADGIVIVVSILLAFTIDAWWAERSDRIEEREILEGLHEEFIRNYELIETITGQVRAYNASTAIYDLVANQSDQNQTISIRNSLLFQMLGTSTFDRVTPVLDGIVSSGKLELIQDQEILLAISIWERDLIQLSESELNARKTAYEQLMPGLRERGNMGELFLLRGDPGNLSTADGETEIQIDTELVGLIADRAAKTERSVILRDVLIASIQAIIEAIEQSESYST